MALNAKLAHVQQACSWRLLSRHCSCFPLTVAPDVFESLQAFTGAALQSLVDSREVDTAALAALLELLAVESPVPPQKHNYAWVAGPVIGGVAGLAAIIVGAWFLRRRRQRAAEPNGFSVAGTDAAVRIRRHADKYPVNPRDAASQASQAAPAPWQPAAGGAAPQAAPAQVWCRPVWQKGGRQLAADLSI